MSVADSHVTLGTVLALDPGQGGFRAATGGFLPAIYGRRGLADMSDETITTLLDDIAAMWFETWRADELTARYHAVGHCDLARTHGGVDRLAAGIQCPLLMLQTSTDQLFDIDEVTSFVKLIPSGRVETIESPFGHLAPAAPRGSAEFDFFERSTIRFLAETGR